MVFDYANRPASIPGAMRAAHDALAARVAAAKEVFRSHFATDALRARLAAIGFDEIEDFGPAEIARQLFPGGAGVASDRGGHIAHVEEKPARGGLH